MTSTVNYEGDLRTTCVHVKSNESIITDAPTDNNGKGQSFSPTDLVATALASCMMTIMGIKANRLEIDLTGTRAEVIKTMVSKPRKISKVEIVIIFPNNEWSQKTKSILEHVARNCPVAKSIHPEIEQLIKFQF